MSGKLGADFNAAVPANSEARSLGASRIRDIKQRLKSAFGVCFNLETGQLKPGVVPGTALEDTDVTPGTYTRVQVDQKGRVIYGENPTTGGGGTTTGGYQIARPTITDSGSPSFPRIFAYGPTAVAHPAIAWNAVDLASAPIYDSNWIVGDPPTGSEDLIAAAGIQADQVVAVELSVKAFYLLPVGVAGGDDEEYEKWDFKAIGGGGPDAADAENLYTVMVFSRDGSESLPPTSATRYKTLPGIEAQAYQYHDDRFNSFSASGTVISPVVVGAATFKHAEWVGNTAGTHFPTAGCKAKRSFSITLTGIIYDASL